jgi:hypothetical protein
MFLLAGIGIIICGGYFWFFCASSLYNKFKNNNTQYEEIRDFRPAEEISDINIVDDEWLYAID